jgi:ribosome maturation factor RimP
MSSVWTNRADNGFRFAYRASHIVRPASNGVVQSGGLGWPTAFIFARTAPRLRAKTVEDREILELVDPVADSLGLEIVRVRLMGGTLRRRLQIMAERPADNDISVEECARLSRAMSEVLDAADPIAGEYLLEVSSPGIDRPLTRLKDFDIFEGLEARLETDRMIEGRKRFKGLLAGTEDESIAIDLDGEDDTALIPFDWLADAKLVMNDALLKRGAAIRAARGEPEDDGLPQGRADQPKTKTEDDA